MCIARGTVKGVRHPSLSSLSISSPFRSSSSLRALLACQLSISNLHHHLSISIPVLSTPYDSCAPCYSRISIRLFSCLEQLRKTAHTKLELPPPSRIKVSITPTRKYTSLSSPARSSFPFFFSAMVVISDEKDRSIRTINSKLKYHIQYSIQSHLSSNFALHLLASPSPSVCFHHHLALSTPTPTLLPFQPLYLPTYHRVFPRRSTTRDDSASRALVLLVNLGLALVSLFLFTYLFVSINLLLPVRSPFPSLQMQMVNSLTLLPGACTQPA